MRRYSGIDKRPGYGSDMEVVMMRMYVNELISRMRFVGHVPKSSD